MPKSDVIVAWKSHATLKRQAGSDSVFDSIIKEIASYLDELPEVIDGAVQQLGFILRKKLK